MNNAHLDFIGEEANASVINFVDHLIKTALIENASDIHIEPQPEHIRIRFRCHGSLQEAIKISSDLGPQIVARIKILSQMNIAECRLPQDGRMTLTKYKNSDIRVSTCPTLLGEKIVLRILRASQSVLSLEKLGFTKEQEQALYENLQAPNGLILVAGPTGSGKTTTLYAALNYLNKECKNIVTIEDPIEIQLPGITQVNINPPIGLNFANDTN